MPESSVGSGRVVGDEGECLERAKQLVDRYLSRFEQQSDVRRAAIIGTLFGLMLCVIVLLICVVLIPISNLGG